MAGRVEATMEGDRVGLLLIDAPPMNFSDWELQEELEVGLGGVKQAGARVVVIGSRVPGYFIAHGHLETVLDAFAGGPTPPGDPRAGLRVQRELDTGPMISLAAIDGQAWGGGAELAWACDLRVASERATFGQPEVVVGTTPAGGAARIARLAGESAAKRMVLDGRPVTAAEAFRLGLVDKLVPPGQALAAALEWAEWLAKRPDGFLATAKAAIIQGRGLPLGEALRKETAQFVARFADPDTVAAARAVQDRYDRGADSYEAFGLPRD